MKPASTRAPGVDGGEYGLFRDLPAHAVDESLVKVGSPLVRQMGVGVDEARAEGGVAQVDHLGSVRNGEPCADGLDGFALDDHDGVGDEGVGLAVEQPGRLENDRNVSLSRPAGGRLRL